MFGREYRFRWRALALIAALSPCASVSAQQPDAQPCAPTMVAEGCGTFVWPDGTRYVGGFHGGFFDGGATVTYPDGARLTLTFKSGAGGGSATYIAADGARITGPFHDVGRDLAHPHPPIDYPFWRALFGDEADVIVAAIVDENGTVRTAQLYRKIESPSYTDAAIAGVKQWRYMPATIGGKPIRMPYLIDIQFSQPR